MQRWRCTTLLLPAVLGLTSASPWVGANAADDLFAMPLEKLEEIVVVGRKRAEGEAIQTVPVAVTVFNERHLKSLAFNSLLDLSYTMPNVSLDEIGTNRGIASFSIRGLSATSSIESFDPAVATFVDGVYLPQNAGTVLDMFDIDSVEVLRGPQGTLFGRNVTGGAVLVRSKRPDHEYSSSLLARYETGGEAPTYTLGATLQGSLSETVAARVAVYYNDDQGYFKNYARRADPTLDVDTALGANDTWFIRPSILWTPAESLNLWIKYEHLKQKGLPPAAQNQANFFGRDDNRVSINYVQEGFYEIDSITAELNWDVGTGTLTNVTGWRSMDAKSGTDIDATRFTRFHSASFLETRAYSNELRYSGSGLSDRLNFTVGSFVYHATLDNVTQRSIFDGATFNEGGGDQETKSYAIFSENEYQLQDAWSLLFGFRYSIEKKHVDFTEIAGSNCEGFATFPLDHLPRCTVTSSDNDRWATIGGKLGATFQPNDHVMFYTHLTRGFRSGGFNVRDTLPDGTNPPSYDEEKIDVLEVGMKADWADGRVRTNLVVFYNWAEDLQRDVNVPAPAGTGGVQQSTANTADAEILGVELEGHWLITDSLRINASVGWLDFDYTAVRFDLDGDGIVTSADKDQTFPRFVEWTYSASMTYERALPIGSLSMQLAYDHRDDTFFTDNNLTPILGPDLISARIGLTLYDEKLAVALYGKNLLDHTVASGSSAVTNTLSAPDPAFGTTTLFDRIGSGTFSPLQQGRTIGLELSLSLD